MAPGAGVAGQAGHGTRLGGTATGPEHRRQSHDAGSAHRTIDGAKRHGKPKASDQLQKNWPGWERCAALLRPLPGGQDEDGAPRSGHDAARDSRSEFGTTPRRGSYGSSPSSEPGRIFGG